MRDIWNGGKVGDGMGDRADADDAGAVVSAGAAAPMETMSLLLK